MTAPKRVIRLSQLTLHPTTLAMLEAYYPKPQGELMLTLDDTLRWEALDTWIRYKEYLANLTSERK